jgi:hypothetical protein
MNAPDLRNIQFAAPEAVAPMRSVARAALACARYTFDKSMRPEEYARKTWEWDTTAHLLTRTAAPPHDMTSAAALIQVAVAMLPALAPFSAAARLFDRTLKVTLGRNAGAFSVPGIAPLGVKFTADGAPKPVLQGSTTAARLDPRKIAGIVPITAELFAQQSVETVMQQLLAESTGPVLDAVVFSNAAATAAAPAGLLQGITPLAATAAGGPATDVLLGDLTNLAAAVGPVAGATDVVYVANIAQGVALQYALAQDLSDYVLVSGAVPAGTVIAIALNAVVSAMGAPEFATGTVATLAMDDAPGAVMTQPTRSLWQTDSVAIKMILDVTWARRSAQGVAWVQGANW